MCRSDPPSLTLDPTQHYCSVGIRLPEFNRDGSLPLNELAASPRPKHIHPKLCEAQKAGLKSQLQDLETELHEYETSKADGPKVLELDSLEGLPKVLIQARIAAGLTQEDLAARLGVKPQQIQRYEASDYQTASFARLREIARLLGLRVRETVELVRN
jgi:ribosome-binding protein aMBF1 (putative translation factor)